MINLTEILGKKIAILHSDGLKVFAAIMEELVAEGHFILNFEGISTSTTAFLNASIGKVLMNSPEAVSKMGIKNADTGILDKINWVKETALNKGRREAREDAMREYLENA
ncbi:STAS-like domain-containing protein [Algoriphagus aquimarinus]|uniref:STAS-like domain-containing protein n=1 Tax=Algoriphagus aquimarinus TaxID=237018 RepID=UPI0030D98CAE|tara:strand:+ start:229724 stop:230053 length:330 start_codon:yes stop_codon:yes gene_type:complete